MSRGTECASVKHAMQLAWHIQDDYNLDQLDDTQLKAALLANPECFEETVGENEWEDDPRYAPDFKGWALEHVAYKNLWVWKYMKGTYVVYCVNESDYSNVNCLDASAFADDVESLVEFANDFGFVDLIIRDDMAVKQTT